MTIVWFAVWLIANVTGEHAPLTFDPVNVWTGTLVLALAIDVNRPRVSPRRRQRDRPKEQT
jgi:hypothetical protein